MIKMLTVLVSTISKSQIFLLKNCDAKATHIFFSKTISIYAIFNDQSFNDTLTKGIVSFEQLGPDVLYAILLETFTAKICLTMVNNRNIPHFGHHIVIKVLTALMDRLCLSVG